MSTLHPLLEKRRLVRLHFLARHLAFEVSARWEIKQRGAYPQWMGLEEWRSYFTEIEGESVDKEVLRELLLAIFSIAAPARLLSYSTFFVAAFLRQLPATEQRLLCNLFKELYCDNRLPSIG